MSYGVVPARTSVIDGSARLRQEDLETQALLPKGSSTAGQQAHLSPAVLLASIGKVSRGPAAGRAEDSSGGAAGDPAARVGKSFESLDYEEYDDTVYRADQAASSSLDSLLYSANKYLVCFAVGVVTALAAFAVNLAVENISGFKFWATLTIMERGDVLGSYLAYTAMNAALVGASVAITLYVGPAAAGSGIADVKAYLNGVDVPHIFHFNTLAAKVLGAIGSVAGGLAIGKEGPFVHAGAAIAAIISQGGSGSARLPWMRNFWNDRDRYDMVACGTAAGVAAAFRSPVGGVLFALEEMTSWWKNQMLWLAFFTTAVVSVAIRVLMKACSANGCGFFGSGGFIYFEIQEGQDTYEFFELLPMLLLGVLGGLMGSGFIVMNTRLSEWRRRNLAPLGRRGRLLEGLAISVLTSTLSFVVPLMVACTACPPGSEGACPRTDDLHSGNFVKFGCRHVGGRGYYNDLATLFFNTQDDAIRNLFASKTKREYTVAALFTFTTIFYFLAALTYGIFAPTGLFVPSILCGAAYGRLVGIFVADMHPGHYIDEGTYALLGAASFLGGAMRMTVCTCVLLLELTNNLALLPLIMLVLLVAKAVGDGTGIKPIYEVQMEIKGLPFLQPQPEAFMRHITAKECCGRPPVTFNRVEKVRSIVETLRSNGHNGFPVLHRGPDGERLICGVVLRQQLLTLLGSGSRSMQPSPTVNDSSSRAALSYSVPEFSKPMSDPAEGSADGVLAPGALGEDVLDLFLDLGPFLNTSYHVVQEDAPLSKVYQLLRTLGLRHICVVPRAHEVVGMITRADLLPDALEKRYSGMPGHYTTDGLNISVHTPGTAGSGSGGSGHAPLSPGGGGAGGSRATTGAGAGGPAGSGGEGGGPGGSAAAGQVGIRADTPTASVAGAASAFAPAAGQAADAATSASAAAATIGNLSRRVAAAGRGFGMLSTGGPGTIAGGGGAGNIELRTTSPTGSVNLPTGR
ncbi:hypothetical protein CHLRE_01g038700v5 [Chlamydomonas reinhardtii]|uniref:Chloride channel protein n=1 Tax=Chlamydomonas reinhardtii TaxID=3055 RepID=A0A2K3E782_CHLRE|nr:uncharacterized protein CHLRE_01g038700v5 [Chlamydomonas reinhardtii]PNW88649.1 hypothetical protein CHLRE_01g038700v5 [Chlamydomonas reinhardtii]